MEADVALHAPEKWAAGDSRYDFEKPEKVTYVYGSRRKDKDTRAAARMQMKPSKSYDNELETSVAREHGLGSSSRSEVPKVKDDMGLRYGNRAGQEHKRTRDPGRDARQVHAQHQTQTQSSPVVSVPVVHERHRGNADAEGAYSPAVKKEKWKPKEKSSPGKKTSHRTRHRHKQRATDSDSHSHSEAVSSRNEGAFSDNHNAPVFQDKSSSETSIPVEFHVKEDQLIMSGPKLQSMRPNTLSSSSSIKSSSLSSLREKPSSLVIVEVKDGPTFFYKPSDHMVSDHMVSDSGLGYDSSILSSSTFSATSANPPFAAPARASSTSAFGFGISAESSPLTVIRKTSLSGPLSSGSTSSLGATASPSYGSPKARHGVSQLPRTSGLRKPDLSVLNTASSKSKGTLRANTGSDGSLHSQVPVTREVDRADLAPATLPTSPTLTLPPPVNVQALVAEPQTSTVEEKSCPSIGFSTDGQNTANSAPQVSRGIPDASLDSYSGCPPITDSVGFQNMSVIMQQKAGIKHDDIVVGPRRPQSYNVPHDEIIVGPRKNLSLEYDSFIGSDYVSPATATPKMTPKNQAVLSLSSDALCSDQPILSLKTDSGRSSPKTLPSRTKVPSLVRNNPKQQKESQKSKEARKHEQRFHKSLDDLQDSSQNIAFCIETGKNGETRISSLSTSRTSEDSSGDGRWRPKERKSGLQRPKRGRKEETVSAESGYATDIHRPEFSDLTALKIPPDPSYNTKSLDRDRRIFGETHSKSKSATTSPAKQQHQQMHSPKSKSSTSTPTKKQSQQSALPRLHMLSNIPVPICHDPPAKRNSYYKPPQAASDATEAGVPSSSIEELLSVSKESPSTPTAINTAESKEDYLIKSSSSPPTSTQPNIASAATTSPESAIEMFTDSSKQQVQDNVDVATQNARAFYDQHSCQPPIALSPKDELCVSQADGSNIGHYAKEEMELSSAKAPSVEDPIQATEGIDDMPSNVPVKPRLHRSAEHLFGDAKLSIFNSTDNVEHFHTKNAPKIRPFNDSAAKSDKSGTGIDSISPLKKAHGLAKIGILRRGSDRTGMCRRGSDRAIIPISRNDPSVEDLKKATSLKELCQSVASLLNIDNERAAEMITTSLSQRQDLVEGLDADAIMDYLSHHGVIDPAVLVGLDDKVTTTQRNSTILKHVEEHGNTAVALFINALRQSGQLHLASSLDTEQRIKPVSGNGYFGKDRHKGEITIRIEIEALKILAPREPRSDKIVDASLLASPSADTPGQILVKDDGEDEDFVKPRSCWCFCFSRKSKARSKSSSKDKKKKSDSKKMNEMPPAAQANAEKQHPQNEDVHNKDANVTRQRSKSKENVKKGKEKDEGAKAADSEQTKRKDQNKSKDKDSVSKKSKTAKSKSKSSGKYSVPDVPAGQENEQLDQRLDSVPDVAFRSGRENVIIAEGQIPSNGDHSSRNGDSGASHKATDSSQLQPYSPQLQSHNGVVRTPSSSSRGPKPDKDNWDPIIMEYDPKLELVKLRAGQEELASPTRQSGNIGIMCEQWKSNGRHFLQKASVLCDKIIQELEMEMVKYFEQDRGTLVLDVISDSSAILVVNICMKRAQVNRLQQEVKDESLLDKMQDMFFSKVDISTFDIRGVKLRIILDEREVDIALSELS